MILKLFVKLKKYFNIARHRLAILLLCWDQIQIVLSPSYIIESLVLLIIWLSPFFVLEYYIRNKIIF